MFLSNDINMGMFRVNCILNILNSNTMCTVYTGIPGPSARPGKPGTPRVKVIAKDSATIEWEAPKSDGDAKIKNYVVEARYTLVLLHK